MNTFTRLSVSRIVAVAALAALAGCASSGASSLAGKSGYRGTDADYVHAVEQTARKRGVRIVWVNPPPEQGKQYLTDVR